MSVCVYAHARACVHALHNIMCTCYHKAPPHTGPHSMGGAVAVRVAVRNVLSTLAGLVVLDVVEGESVSEMIIIMNAIFQQALLSMSCYSNGL